jgi:RNA polymerase sigma-70 factor (ECF subfamily)
VEVTAALQIAARVEESDLEERFASFVASHRERALRLAWRLVGGDDAAAEDVTQEAFIKAYRGLRSFREEASLGTWFYRILVREASNHRRWRRVRERWLVPLTREDLVPGPEAPTEVVLRRRIARALDTLSPAQRGAFVLVHMEGFTVAEAAEVLGKAPGTVKSHLHRALVGLRRELADLHLDEGEGAQR